MSYRFSLLFGRVSWAIALGGGAIAGLPAQAQIIPDATLPVNSQVAAGCQVCAIAGGTVRGSYLFHSFREFSIPTGGAAQFQNAPQIHTILNRVTGSQASRIDGLIQANGTANVFLLNPNGITFGPNASLQVGGAFVASTAPSFQFPDGSEFSAINPQAPPLLAVNVTPGLQYGRGLAPIENSGNLAVNPGQSLTLSGSDVLHRGTLTAPGGRVELLGDRVALLDQAQIKVSAPMAGGTVLIGGDFQGKGLVPKARRTFVAPGARIEADGVRTGNGGRVIVWADEATRFYGQVSAQGGERGGDGGFVEISGRDFLDYQGQVNTLAPQGRVGTLLLDPVNITVVAGGNNPPELAANDQFADPGVNSAIANGTINNATTNVTLQATNNVTFTAPIAMVNPGLGLTVEAGNNITFQGFVIPFLGSTPGVLTNGGDVNLRAGGDVVIDRFAIRTDSLGGAAAGDITITTGPTGRLLLQNRGILTADTRGAGTAGTITIQGGTVDVLTPIGTRNLSGISANTTGSGSAGKIAIAANRLAVDGAVIQAFTNGPGDAGEITVQANEIAVTGQGRLGGIDGGLFANSNTSLAGTGKAGAITLEAQRLSVRDGAGIYANSISANPGGRVTVRAADIEVSGQGLRPSSVSVGAPAAFGARGDGGTMQLVADRLTIRNGAIVEASALNGQGGTVNVQANTVNVLDGGNLGADGRNGGQLTVETGQLRVQNGSFISVGTLAGNAGGLVQIRARDRVEVLDSSGISADAFGGQGGNVLVETQDFRLQNLSTVSAGTFGRGVAGNVSVRGSNSVLVDRSFLGLSSLGTVTGGSLSIATGNLTVQNGGGVVATLIGQGTGGDLRVAAGNLTVRESSFLTTSVVGQGQGGNLAVQVDGAIQLDQRGTISTAAFGAGRGGDLAIAARQLDVRNRSSINTLSAGDLTSATRSAVFGELQLDVFSASPFLSGLFQLVNTSALAATEAGAVGQAGNLTVQVTETVAIANQGSFATAAEGRANGGRLLLQTGNLNLGNGGSLLSDVNGPGRGGDIAVQANNLQLQNGLISSRGTALGTAANITLSLTDTLTVNGSGILASATQAGGGNIAINARDIRLRNGSLVSTSVFDSVGGGGNIDIRSQIFIALEDSDILANAELGPGGNIFINSPTFLADLFGTGQATAVGRNPGSFAPFRGNGRVDISAESRAGTSGTVTFPQVDPARGITPLVTELVDPTQQIDQRCGWRGDRASSFTVTGRGGLPTDPTQPLEDEAVWVDWIGGTAAESGSSAQPRGAIAQSAIPGAIVEAQGWRLAPDGEIYLVAAAKPRLAVVPGFPVVDCNSTRR